MHPERFEERGRGRERETQKSSTCTDAVCFVSLRPLNRSVTAQAAITRSQFSPIFFGFDATSPDDAVWGRERERGNTDGGNAELENMSGVGVVRFSLKFQNSAHKNEISSFPCGSRV